MVRRTIGSVLAIVTLSFGCGSEPSPDATVDALLRLGAVNLGLNANQPDVRERQDLYLSTAPGTDHSFLVDATEDIDILCTNEMYTSRRLLRRPRRGP